MIADEWNLWRTGIAKPYVNNYIPWLFRAAEITEPGPGVPPITGPAQQSKESGMGDKDWQPFVYGGLASCTAEFGMFVIEGIVSLSSLWLI
jgi:hypothetical protein